MKEYVFKDNNKVNIINSQAKFMESAGFTPAWGNDGPMGGFVQWKKKVNDLEIILLLSPKEKIDYNKLINLIIKRTVYHTKRKLEEKFASLNIFSDEI